MATERQIQANRANAKRSTGPVTEEGKKASSQNARRHDQLSSTVVLAAESTPFFNDLMNSLIDELQPRTANETALVENMAVARWKLMRNWTLHTALLEVEIGKQDPGAGNEPVIAALAFKNLADTSRSLQLLQRYEVSLDRQYSRALNNLLKGRAAAVAQAAKPAESTFSPEPPEQPTPEPAPPEPIQKFPKEPNLPPEPAAVSRQNQTRPASKPAPVTSITSGTPVTPAVTAATPPKTGRI